MKAFNIFLRVFFLLTIFHLGAFAAPADKTQTFSKKQKNGKTITYTLNGDEFISWLTSTDGYTLFENQEQEIVYAIKDEDGKLNKSNVLASDSQYRSVEEILFLSSIEKGLFYNSSQLEVFNKNREERYSNNQINYIPTTGTPNFLVILVGFSDIPFNTTNATKMSSQISQTNYTLDGATGSVKDYFYDNSMGALNANFTVVGPYTLSQNQAYYGANDSGGDDIRPREMVAEACSLASQYINFANFDNDNDGYVDMIHIIYAGRGEHNGGGANAIWAHSWSLSPIPTYNGVSLYKYSCSNELRTTTQVDGIGTICHEMGHVLGLPDFYDTDYAGSGGQSIDLGTWDLMASGSYNNSSKTPPYLSAIEREMLGWLSPIILTNNNTPCTLPAISDSNKAYKVNLSSNEFFIFEHRKKKKWDTYLPAKGMLVFHGDNTMINQWLNSRINKINVNPNNRGFFIIPAYGDSSNINSASTTYPGSQNISSFIGSKLKNFTPTGKALLSISYGLDSILNFTYFNSVPTSTLTILPPTNITTTSATLNGTVSGSGITSKGFQYRVLGTSTFTQQSVTASPLQLTINSLTPNTTYEYRIFIVSSIGTTYSEIDTFTTDCGLILTPPFTEGFETTLTCWSNISSDTNHLNVVQNGSSPTCTRHGGANMLKYNSFGISANEWTGLISPKIIFPHSSFNVSLWIYRYNGTYSKPEEGIEIYVNSSKSLDGATQIGFISNSRSVAPATSSNGWYNYSCNVGQQAVGESYIILKAVSKYGYNIYIDDLSVYSTLIIPPTIRTDSIKNITHNSAIIHSSFTAGSQSIISKGLEYRPSINSNWDSISAQGITSPFSVTLTQLIPNTYYIIRPYVVTASGRNYPSAIDSFMTQPLILPIVITDTSTFNNPYSISVYGSYVQGSDPILTSGFKYKPSTTNTWATITQTSNNQTFNSTINSLQLSTTYDYRSFVTHSTGTTYGETKTFTTLSPPTISFEPIRGFCLNESSILLDIAYPQGGVYSGAGITNSNQFNPSQAGLGNHYIKYNYTDINTLSAIDSFSIRVNANPVITLLQSDSLEICQGDSIQIGIQAIAGGTYEWYKDSSIIIGENSNTYYAKTASNYNVFVIDANNCSSISYYTNLKLNQTSTSTITATICQGGTYTDNGFNESQAGLHSLSLQAINGCDSIVTLNLIVNPAYYKTFNITISEGETYSLNGFNASITGLYTQNLQTVNGCDSIVVLNLIVYPAFTTIFDASICPGDAYNLNGFDENTTGVYTQNLQTINGSDSIVILNLSVNPIFNNTITASICQGEFYNQFGFNENQTGFYTQNLQTINGCDSIVNLSLIAKPIYNDTIIASICQGETYIANGFNENTAGVYTQTHQTINGCDSIFSLKLIVNPVYDYIINGFICQGETYTLNGFNETAAGFYTQTLQTINGCDSIVNLSLIVNPTYTTSFNSSICQGETYSLNGFNENTTGIYTQNLQTINGCDSIIILNLTVNPTYNNTIIASICQGEIYNQFGFNETAVGFYTQTLQTINGCDSIVNLSLIVNPTYTTSFNASICQGETYSLNGFNENTTGTYTQNLQTINGCDSIIILNLTVNPTYNNTIIASICQGEIYNQFGFNENAAGFYTQTLQTINGCDSIVNLNLIVNPTYTTSFNASICQGETYSLNGFNENTTGIYTQNLQTINGCDSIINLNLIVNPTYTSSFNATICEGNTYNLNGFNESTAGTYTQTLQTVNGCDSIINLNLIVNPTYTSSFNASICQGETYNLNGFNENTAGTYTQTLQTTNGCDSTITLNLMVNPNYNQTITASICQGQTYNLNGFNENISGTYTKNLQTINGCDSIIVLNLIINQVTTPTNLALDNIQNYFELSWQGDAGQYIIYRDNDSIGSTTNTSYRDTNVVEGVTYCYKVKTNEGECESESIEICQEFLGLNNNINNNEISIILYPNPAISNTILKVEGLRKAVEVFVFDITGRHLKTYKLEANQKELNIDLTNFAKGIYQIKILNQTKKLIVN